MAKPLAGKRILVTRARHQASRLAEALKAAGAEVLSLPTIEIVPPESYAPLDEALATISRYDWLIVTSANGAEQLAGRMKLLGIEAEQLSHLEIAAIGPATAEALKRAGLNVTAVPDQYVAEGVVGLLGQRVAGKRVLLARAAVARDVIPDELRKHGAVLDVVEAYRTEMPAESIHQVRGLLSGQNPLPDLVSFTSASTVHNFFALLAAAQVELPRALRAASIGPITTRALRDHEWEPACEASPSDIAGLVDACVQWSAAS